MSRYFSQPRSLSLAIAIALAAMCVLSSGCSTLFNSWDYPEFQVPQERLREIDTLDLEAVSVPDDLDVQKLYGEKTDTQPSAPQPPAEIQLSLAQSRALALQGNLTLKAELLNPTIAAENITQSEAAFESIFFTDATYSKTDTPTASTLTGAKVEFLEITPGVRIPIRTGGAITLAHPMTKYETNNTFSTLNPSYATDFTASITQPLLRGAGPRANTHPIRIARLGYQQSEAATKLSVIGVLAATDRLYWVLRAVRLELKVRKQEHDLAKAQLEHARHLVEAGTKPEVEVVRAELGVADTLEAIIVAENAVRDSQRALKRILQKPGMGMGSQTVVVPVTEPIVGQYKLDPEQVVKLALANRMELLVLELQIARDSSTIDFERNQTLPLVTLGYTYNSNGLGRDLGAASDTFFDNRFEDHRFGLQVEIPIGNQAARSRLRRGILQRIQLLASKKNRESLIRQEVYNAIDQLEANWQRILAGRQTVIHAKRVLEAEQRQFDQGLRTSTEVLEAQAAYANAQSSVIRAVAEYQIAQVDLAYATGTLLGSARVRWEPTKPTEILGE